MESNTMGVEVPTQVYDTEVTLPSTGTPGFSGDWKDFQKDMALLSAKAEPAPNVEITPIQVETPADTEPRDNQAVEQTQQAQPTPEPTKPVVQAAPTAPVPDKFKAPDGSLDQEKIIKSYLEAEKTVKRLQNQGQQAQTQPAIPATPMAADAPFEARVYQDFVSSGLDPKAAQALVPTITRLFAAASDAGYERAMAEVSSFRQAQQETKSREELKAIINSDPSIGTPEGMDYLVSIRNDNPWLNHSPEPWKAAWQLKIANEALKRPTQAGQVKMPTPKAVTAPNAPVTAAPPTVGPQINLNDKESVNRHLASLSSEQKGEFFKRYFGKQIKW